MNKIQIFSDLNKKSIFIKKKIVEKKNLINPFYKKKLLIIIGGDGFMLKVLKKKIHENNFFYGINSGNYGFLMNKFNIKSLDINNLKKMKKITISPLVMRTLTKDKKVKKSLAINEVSVLRQSKQAANLIILNQNRKIINKLVADGVLVSTPAGSTAYNLSVHGPILNLNSNKISLAPISPFRPRRWRAKVLSDKSKIVIKNLELNKRPISVTADNYEVRNVKKVFIKVDKKIKLTLLYDKNQSLQNKIKLEQVRKETD